MATWAELNQAAGGQASAPVPSAAQSGGWAAANARSVEAIGASYVPNVPKIDMAIQDRAIANLPEGAPFLRDAVISAPPASDKKFQLLGVTINRPTSLYGTASGRPIIDVDPNRFEAKTSEDANFLQRMGAAGINTIGQSILGISESFSNLFEIGIIDNVTRDKDISLNEEGVPELSDGTPVLYPGVRERLEQGLPAQPTGAEKVGATISAGASVAGGAFTPVAAQLEMARELPVIGKPVFGTILKGFELLDHASRFVGTKLVDVLPVDDQSKAVLRRPIEDLAGIVGTLFGVKAIHTAGAKGGGRVVDALPVSEGTKGQIRGGVQLGAGVALEPFTVAYRGMVNTIRTKTETRQAAGQEVTPETARTIVNETVKEVRTPDIKAIMEVPTAQGRTRVYTNQKLVLENLIKGREDLNYKRVDDLGIQLKTDTPITSRFEWDYAKQQGTIYTTSKTTAVDLARELGHYVDRQLGAALSIRLSEVLPEYRQNRDQINQLLADYALNRLDGNAAHKEINAEIVKIADNIKTEIESVRTAEERQRPAQEFAQAVGDIINDPLRRKQSPELAQLIDYSIGRDAARQGGKADVTGERGTKAESESILGTLEKSKRAAIKQTRTEDQGFYEQRLKEETARQAILDAGEDASGNTYWQQMTRALRDSAEFKKEGTLTDRTIDGVRMERNGKFRVVSFADVKKMQKNGWESGFTMDEIAHANGFERAQDYVEYIMALDGELRGLGTTSEKRAAHEYLLKNDPNYEKLNDQIEILREELKGEEEQIYGAEQPTGQVDRTAPSEERIAGEVQKVEAEGVDTSDPLIEQAQGFKSADEFVKAQGTVDNYGVAQNPVLKQKADALIDDLMADSGKGKVKLYHGTDSETAKQIYEAGYFQSGKDYPSFFTTSRKEALEYANNKTKYRNQGTPEVIEIEAPKYAVSKNTSTGEYETHTGVNLYFKGKDAYLNDIELLEAFEKMPTKSQLTDIWNKANSDVTAERIAAGRDAEIGERRVETRGEEAPVRTGTSKVGESIARKVVEQKLEDSYKGTAEYERINIKDQARRVEELINSDIEQAKRIMTGEEALPDGMRAGALIKGMEEYALRSGDPELAFELANSPLVSETSIHAQEMRLLAERSPDSATARLQEVKKARIAEAEKRLQKGETLNSAVKKARNELAEEVKKTRPKKEDWSSFIESIKC